MSTRDEILTGFDKQVTMIREALYTQNYQFSLLCSEKLSTYLVVKIKELGEGE